VLAPALAATRPVAESPAIGAGEAFAKAVAKLWNASPVRPGSCACGCELLAIRDPPRRACSNSLVIAVMEKASCPRATASG